mmetsp:Transcript_2545/g.7227  ORF Transcript_2545/g.7227 Transcript_2545/m.7227 type:complete len:193 (+) Transcript_2545:180-758(+)|eukprot:CAMPEP_0117687462 /NCGR_PEP_ID=MMETSP0804-20121206/23156_1 /TAXON_ID=1074897 /ORGANISM="Tetraselmis astigmatica, Strain CCMP880" /LENGTH=192 /DNA_ID=CAMNT_0005499543 /DNA_START=122 /DNA_END=700 /DNA_ORIENTATION=-
MPLKLSKENVPLLLALAGYAFTYWHTKASDTRLKRIERVSDQVKLLYGPLLAAVTASKKAFEAMIRLHSPDGSPETFIQTARSQPGSKEAQAYRLWMTEVLQPLNEKAAKVLSENTDLLETDDVEPLLLHLISHVASNRVILKGWQAGDMDTRKLPITYPDGLLAYVQGEYSRLKAIQAKLIGVPHGRRSKL